MSKYTTQLRHICEMKGNAKNKDDVLEVTRQAIKHIYDSDVLAYFPWQYYYKTMNITLQQKILLHYYTQEIGFETYGLWRLKFNQKLREIMPYYQQLYKTTAMHFTQNYDGEMELNIFDNVDITETTRNVTTENVFNSATVNNTIEYSGESKQTFTENNTNKNDTIVSNNERNAYSNTPQGTLIDVENGTYLTDYRNIQNNNNTTVNDTNTRQGNNVNAFKDRKDIAENKANSNGNKTANNDITKQIKGKNTTETKTAVIVEFRNSLINIDNMVIDELKNLFMMLY